MPTRADFEAAAETFLSAAAQVSTLTTHVDQIDVTDIIRGGALGAVVPSRIARASSTAQACRVLIENAAQTCLHRAAIIADYELSLAHYDRLFVTYQQSSRYWQVRYNRWWRSFGQMPHPGARPVPPLKPQAPPEWADVRRP